MYILGIHGNFGRSEHDPAAALVAGGDILAAAEEERFLRQKHAVGMIPEKAISFCLSKANISIRDVDIVSFPRATWSGFKARLQAFFEYRFGYCPKIVFVDHHLAHAASAFYVSGFSKALIVTIDQSGDGVALGIYRGEETEIRMVHQELYPNSLGLFAALMTQYLGFRSNHEEYKVMGLAAHGKPVVDLDFILQVTSSGYTFHEEVLHSEARRKYPEFHTEQLPIFNKEVERRLPPRRLSHEPILQEHADIASSVQKRLEEAFFSILLKYKEPEDINLCLSGGVAHNSVLNGKIVESNLFESIYVPPAANDAGTALGAAIHAAVAERFRFGPLQTCLLGPEYADQTVKQILIRTGAPFRQIEDPSLEAARLLAEDEIVAWFQGSAEFGPRALGARSLLANPHRPNMKDKINVIKHRGSFQPFAPSILHEKAEKRFDAYLYSPFMSFTLSVNEYGLQEFPAAIHVDNSARAHSVEPSGGLYRSLLEQFYDRTGIPAVLNTSLNAGWEPIVLTPEDALAFFFSSPVGSLVIGNYLVSKK